VGRADGAHDVVPVAPFFSVEARLRRVGNCMSIPTLAFGGPPLSIMCNKMQRSLESRRLTGQYNGQGLVEAVVRLWKQDRRPWSRSSSCTEPCPP
jgi:hypothetical protein